jgi:hypothetical protein
MCFEELGKNSAASYQTYATTQAAMDATLNDFRDVWTGNIQSVNSYGESKTQPITLNLSVSRGIGTLPKTLDLGTLAIPNSQQVFPIYEPLTSPVITLDPSQAKPIGIGSVASGGNMLSLQIGLAQFTSAVDVYFAIYAPSIDPNNIYLLTSDNTIQMASKSLVPWKHNMTTSMDENVLGDISISQLPAGTYYFGVLVSPPDTGISDSYYLWITSMSLQPPISYLETDLDPLYLTTDGTNIFWSDPSEAPIKKSSGIWEVVALARTIGVPTGLTLSGQNIFWIDDQNEPSDCGTSGLRILYETSLDGTTTTALTQGTNCQNETTADIVVDDSYIYWVSTDAYETSSIMKTPIAGGASTVLVERSPTKNPGTISALKGDAANIYWEEFSDLLSIPKAGGTPVIISGGNTFLRGDFVVSGDAIIFADDYSTGTVSTKYRIMQVSISDGTISTLVNIDSTPNENYVGKIVADSTDVYWIDKMSVNKIPLSGGPITKLADVQNYMAIDLAVNQDTVFWTELPQLTAQGGPLKAVPKTGGAVTVLHQDDRVTPYKLALASDYIFWTEGGLDIHDISLYTGFARIAKMPITGATPVTLASGVSQPPPLIAADKNNIYIGDGYAIKEVSLNGGIVERMAITSQPVTAIGTDGTNIYWQAGPIYKVPISGGAAIALTDASYLSGTSSTNLPDARSTSYSVPVPTHPSPLWVVNGYVYWMESAIIDGEIFRVSTSGGSTETVVSGIQSLYYFVVDGTYVYYSEQSSGLIIKVSVNGGPPAVIESRPGGGNQILLAVDDQALYWIDAFELGKIAISGGNPIHIIDTGVDVQALTLSDTTVYWGYTDFSLSEGYIVEVTPK